MEPSRYAGGSAPGYLHMIVQALFHAGWDDRGSGTPMTATVQDTYHIWRPARHTAERAGALARTVTDEKQRAAMLQK